MIPAIIAFIQNSSFLIYFREETPLHSQLAGTFTTSTHKKRKHRERALSFLRKWFTDPVAKREMKSLEDLGS